MRSLLLCFHVVLHLEDVHLQCLFMLSHVAQYGGLGFVKGIIYPG